MAHVEQGHGHHENQGRLERWGKAVRNFFLTTAAVTGILNPQVVLRWTAASATNLLSYVADPSTIGISLAIAAGGEVVRRLGKNQGHGGH